MTPQPECEDHLADASSATYSTEHGNTAILPINTNQIAESRSTLFATTVTPLEQTSHATSGMAPSSSHESPPLPSAPPAVISRPATSAMDPTTAYHSYEATQDTGPLRASAATAAAAWGSWDEHSPSDLSDYEWHEGNIFFRAKARCNYCRKENWNEFGYGASPYLDLVSKGWKKGKQGWRRAYCPECAQTW